MVAESKQTYDKDAQILSERLKSAYERISPNLRPKAVDAFCKAHGISADTFRKKRAGTCRYVATEQECIWLESYNPYS